MRFISPNPGYKFVAVKEVYELLASGQFRQISPPYICEFSVTDKTDWEVDIARKTFKFRGVPHDESGVREIDPVPSRVSSFDTSRISDPTLRARVEKRLLESQSPENHIFVEKPELSAPWPAYPNLVAQGRRTNDAIALKIVEVIGEQGYDPEYVLEYEKANLNRPEVISALQGLSKPKADEEELIVA